MALPGIKLALTRFKVGDGGFLGMQLLLQRKDLRQDRHLFLIALLVALAVFALLVPQLLRRPSCQTPQACRSWQDKGQRPDSIMTRAQQAMAASIRSSWHTCCDKRSALAESASTCCA